MEKKMYYFAPAVRVRPIAMAGEVLAGDSIPTDPNLEGQDDDNWAKEGTEGLDGATYQPYSSIWED